MHDYSQNGEGRIIHEFFGDFKGTLLDLGANDGITLSNSRGLIEAGWTGALVEPAKAAFRKLLDNYLVTGLGRKPNDFNGTPGEYYAFLSGGMVYAPGGRVRLINAAITTQDGPIDFWDCGVHLHKNDTSLLSTTRPETIARWKRSGEQFAKTTVRGITFETLLKETGVNHFDFISIDCEGADLDILAQIDLAAVGCRMLCVETNGNNQPFIDLAAKGGMKAYRRVVENMIFVR